MKKREGFGDYNGLVVPSSSQQRRLFSSSPTCVGAFPGLPYSTTTTATATTTTTISMFDEFDLVGDIVLRWSYDSTLMDDNGDDDDNNNYHLTKNRKQQQKQTQQDAVQIQQHQTQDDNRDEENDADDNTHNKSYNASAVVMAKKESDGTQYDDNKEEEEEEEEGAIDTKYDDNKEDEDDDIVTGIELKHSKNHDIETKRTDYDASVDNSSNRSTSNTNSSNNNSSNINARRRSVRFESDVMTYHYSLREEIEIAVRYEQWQQLRKQISEGQHPMPTREEIERNVQRTVEQILVLDRSTYWYSSAELLHQRQQQKRDMIDDNDVSSCSFFAFPLPNMASFVSSDYEEEWWYSKTSLTCKVLGILLKV